MGYFPFQLRFSCVLSYRTVILINKFIEKTYLTCFQVVLLISEQFCYCTRTVPLHDFFPLISSFKFTEISNFSKAYEPNWQLLQPKQAIDSFFLIWIPQNAFMTKGQGVKRFLANAQIDKVGASLCFVSDCVTQLNLYTVDKLSSTIFCCLWDVRHQ